MKYYSYAIGRDINRCRNDFLYAPEGYFLDIGDVVVANDKTYRILYARHYATLESPDVLAIKIALDMQPIKIQKKLTEEVFVWKDDADDDVDG